MLLLVLFHFRCLSCLVFFESFWLRHHFISVYHRAISGCLVDGLDYGQLVLVCQAQFAFILLPDYKCIREVICCLSLSAYTFLFSSVAAYTFLLYCTCTCSYLYLYLLHLSYAVLSITL